MLINQSNAQALKLTDLEKLFSYSYDKIDTHLTLKGFEFDGVDNRENCEVIQYTLKIDDFHREYFFKYKYEDGGVMLSYNIFDAKAYSIIKQSLTSNGFVFEDQETYKGNLILNYKKSKVYLSLLSGVVEPDQGESYTSYEISLANEIFANP